MPCLRIEKIAETNIEIDDVKVDGVPDNKTNRDNYWKIIYGNASSGVFKGWKEGKLSFQWNKSGNKKLAVVTVAENENFEKFGLFVDVKYPVIN